MKNIRNFCIIAHIDHGKSTLADRFLEMTGTVEKRDMKEQLLDSMDLERERGITIKLQPATMEYEGHTLNLIDTPGHVDFGYEVSRSLAAVEGAVLLVDATKGVQAQTMANLYQAVEQDLEIIPVVNKIDMPNAEIEKTKKEILHILGCEEDEIILASGKTGAGAEKILQAIIEKVPAPQGDKEKPSRALIFDSKYDSYKGVLAYVRIVDGEMQAGEESFLIAAKESSKIIEVGKFTPELIRQEKLSAGDIGYIATGFKSVDQCQVGDTITILSEKKQQNVKPLSGYKQIKPMVYASFYPAEGEDYNQMRLALEKLKLNDAALDFEGESSPILGKGFRLGFLGLLHLEIVQERLKREFDFHPVITTPSVAYKVIKTNNSEEMIYAASELPDQSGIKEIQEPWVKLTILSPAKYLGDIMKFIGEATRAKYLSTDYIDQTRVSIEYDAPLSEVIVNFHDSLKSASSGFASMNYEISGYQTHDLVRLDIYVAEERINAFSQIIPRERIIGEGKRVVAKLQKAIPRQNFLIKLQAAVGGKIVARENIKAFRKDVTGDLYGGDITRKRKLLEKQKKGKKKRGGAGKANIPQEAFLEVIKR
jgi:GTP-binding protein LepA